MIIFLDIDGVLNVPFYQGPEMFYPEYANQLADIVIKHNLQIVISSSWRESSSLDIIKTYFREDIQAKIIGMTPVLQSIDNYRHLEILEWMSDNCYSGPWIAIDDDKRIFEYKCRNLLECDFSFGLDIFKQSQLEEMIYNLK